MKKFLFPIIAIALTLGFSSCSFEEDDLFEASAADRLNAAVKKYSASVASDGGTYIMEYWPTFYSTQPGVPTGQGYLVCMEFHKDGSVRMGAKHTFTNNTYKEETSAWEVITDLGAVLSFNSYNKLFHCFSDPSDVIEVDGKLIYTGDRGTGVGGDYEFIITDISADNSVYTLKGKKNGTYSRMIRLPEGTDFDAYLTDIENFKSTVFPKEMNNYLPMKVGETVFKSEDWNTADANIYPFNGRSDLDVSRYPFIINKFGGKYHLSFRDDIEGNNEGESVKELVYNEQTGLFENEAEPQKYVLQQMRDGDMYEFFHTATELGQKWTLDLEQASPEFMDCYAKLIEGSKPTPSSSYAWKLNTNKGFGITISSTDYYDKSRPYTYTVDFNFLQNKTRQTLTYYFTANELDNSYRLTFKEAKAGNSERYQGSLEGLQTLLDLLAGEFTQGRATTQGYYVFDTKMINSANSSWYVIKK